MSGSNSGAIVGTSSLFCSATTLASALACTLAEHAGYHIMLAGGGGDFGIHNGFKGFYYIIKTTKLRPSRSNASIRLTQCPRDWEAMP